MSDQSCAACAARGITVSKLTLQVNPAAAPPGASGDLGALCPCCSPFWTQCAGVSSLGTKVVARAPPGGARAPPGAVQAPPGGARAPPGVVLAPPGSARAPPGGARPPTAVAAAPSTLITAYLRPSGAPSNTRPTH